MADFSFYLNIKTKYYYTLICCDKQCGLCWCRTGFAQSSLNRRAEPESGKAAFSRPNDKERF